MRLWRECCANHIEMREENGGILVELSRSVWGSVGT